MDLNALVERQVKMDEAHGFPVKFGTTANKYQQLTKDLVGLFGEIGEFSNIVKKINISLDHPNEYQVSMSDAEERLCSELVDCLIYVLRIGAILDIDLQAELLHTMEKNAVRYEKLQPR